MGPHPEHLVEPKPPGAIPRGVSKPIEWEVDWRRLVRRHFAIVTHPHGQRQPKALLCRWGATASSDTGGRRGIEQDAVGPTLSTMMRLPDATVQVVLPAVRAVLEDGAKATSTS